MNLSTKRSELHHLFLSYHILHNHSPSRTMTINVPNPRPSVSSDVSSFAIRSTSSADMIRGRFLFKLGIYDPNFTNASIYHKIQRESCFARPVKDTFFTQDTSPRRTQPLPPPRGVGHEVSKDRDTRISPFKAHYPVPLVPEQASAYADIERLPHLASMSDTSSFSSSRSIRCIRREEPRDQDSRGTWHVAHYLVPLKFEQESKDGDTAHLPHLMLMGEMSSSLSTSSLSAEGGGGRISDPPSQARTIRYIAPSGKSRPRGPVCVRFDPSVAVLPIPSHRSYDRRTRSRLHATKDEMSSDIARNTLEFTYEGWDWRNAVEEVGMYVRKASGELVHPAHVVYGHENTVL